MVESKLEIDKRFDRIEAALGTLADSLDYGEIVRMILYKPEVFDGGGEAREEGVVTPEELDRAHTIAKAFHEAYERLAPSFEYSTRVESAMGWEDLPQQNKMLMTAVVAELLDKRIIFDEPVVKYRS